jgi:hypothetical protein
MTAEQGMLRRVWDETKYRFVIKEAELGFCVYYYITVRPFFSSTAENL